MVELDGDDIRISSRGKMAERDIVQVGLESLHLVFFLVSAKEKRSFWCCPTFKGVYLRNSTFKSWSSTREMFTRPWNMCSPSEHINSAICCFFVQFCLTLFFFNYKSLVITLNSNIKWNSDWVVTWNCSAESVASLLTLGFLPVTTVCPIQGLHGSHGEPRAEHGAPGEGRPGRDPRPADLVHEE